MVTWVLIVFAHVGMMGDGNSNALTSVPGFASAQECQAAGAAVKKLAQGTVKSIDFVCVSQGAPGK
jgi:hypothetical protein